MSEEFEQENQTPRVPIRKRIAIIVWALLAVAMGIAWYPSYNNAYVLGVRQVSWGPSTLPGASQERRSFSATLNLAMGRVGLYIGRGTFNATFPNPEKAGWSTEFGSKPHPQNVADRGYLGGFSFRRSSNTGIDAAVNPGFSTQFGVPIYFVLGIAGLAVACHVRNHRNRRVQKTEPGFEVSEPDPFAKPAAAPQEGVSQRPMF